MKANPLSCALLVLLAIAGQLSAQTSTTNAARTNRTSVLRVSSKANPDGSVIQASFDWETEEELMVEELATITNAVAATTNKFSVENKALAEKGDSGAQADLGYRYFAGFGVAKDFAEAVKWFRQAADQGNYFAENNLGACYANGLGVEKDEAEAAHWYRKAAEQNDGDAQYCLGRAYETGRGIDTNVAEATKWYYKAANNYSASAQEWIRKAAENGDASAQNYLGTLYARGLICVNDGSETRYSENPTEAVKWYRRAAEQGDASGQDDLGVAYLDGKGVPMDQVEAYKWFNLAAAQGGLAEIAATTMRDDLAKKMTTDQIAEAQLLSREFRPRKESGSDNSPASDSPTATGTGFFITDDGYLISNHHVVKDAAKVRLLTGAGLLDASVVKVDAANDLALLKAVGAFKPLPIAASRTVKLGGTVATVGFPDIGLQGFAPKLAKGEIASLAGATDDPRYFQISVPVQPGNSGGALVDARGNVVGIVAAKLDASAALAATGSLPENVNYAVKSSLLLSFLESVPDVDAKLKEPNTKDESFEDVVKSAQDAAVLVLVY